MKKGIIRALVICIFQKDDSILVAEGYDKGVPIFCKKWVWI
ncbi:hypothetical protein [Solibacillus sp. FSL K6-4121]